MVGTTAVHICFLFSGTIKERNKEETFDAVAKPDSPCLKRDHGAFSSIYKFPALPISSTAPQADDNSRFS